MTNFESTGLISDAAYSTIQDMITTGKLRSGSMISENELRETLKCGRTPIREALQRLQLEGFVEIHPRRGALVTSVDIRKQLDLLEVRRPLEITMVKLAAQRADQEQRRRMRELADSLEAAVAADDREKYFGINRATHEIEAAASKNGALVRTMAQVHNLSRRFWYSFITSSDDFAEAAKFHSGTLRSIAEGNESEAEANANGLLDYLNSVTRAAIGKPAP